MSPTAASGHHLPNFFASAMLHGLEDLLGAHGVRALLRLAGLGQWVQSPPDASLGAEVDFAEFATLQASLADLYGERSARTMARRAGREIAQRTAELLEDISSLLEEPAFKALDAEERGARLLDALAQALSQASSRQDRVEHVAGSLRYVAAVCPDCWGRASDQPLCAVTTGWLEGVLSLLEGWESPSIQEVACAAMGADGCTFEVDRQGGT